MRVLIVVNGDYGDQNWYIGRAADFDWVILVDGGANHARRLGIKGDLVVGDMDSIELEVREAAAAAGADFVVTPREKNDTDTQLAFKTVISRGADEVVVWGGTGSRLDHSFSNLSSAASLVEAGMRVRFEGPDMDIHITGSSLTLNGSRGDTVSIIILGGQARGITISGFQYPLHEANMDFRWQWAISNVMLSTEAAVTVEEGILAVVHFKTPVA